MTLLLLACESSSVEADRSHASLHNSARDVCRCFVMPLFAANETPKTAGKHWTGLGARVTDNGWYKRTRTDERIRKRCTRRKWRYHTRTIINLCKRKWRCCTGRALWPWWGGGYHRRSSPTAAACPLPPSPDGRRIPRSPPPRRRRRKPTGLATLRQRYPDARRADNKENARAVYSPAVPLTGGVCVYYRPSIIAAAKEVRVTSRANVTITQSRLRSRARFTATRIARKSKNPSRRFCGWRGWGTALTIGNPKRHKRVTKQHIGVENRPRVLPTQRGTRFQNNDSYTLLLLFVRNLVRYTARFVLVYCKYLHAKRL